MKKCVIIIDEELPVGIKANTSAVLALTIGHKVSEIIDVNVCDASGDIHLGITNIALPILKATRSELATICRSAKLMDDLLVVDFCDIAQQSLDYPDYVQKISKAEASQITYRGVALYGPKKKVNSLSGSLALLK